MKENEWFRICEHPAAPRKEKKTARSFYCPGCKCCHWFDEIWNLTYKDEKPSLTPSLLVNGRLTEAHKKSGAHRCHLYIKCGSIQYLSDCTHELAGQTINMVKEGDN